MPSRQQRSAKNVPKMYLLIQLNPVLVILMFDDGHFPDQKNIHGWLLKEP